MGRDKMKSELWLRRLRSASSPTEMRPGAASSSFGPTTEVFRLVRVIVVSVKS
jgi:hypothetical protein